MTDKVKHIKCRECGFTTTLIGSPFQVHEKLRLEREKHDNVKVMSK